MVDHHITLDHLKRDGIGKTPLVKLIFGREQGIGADVSGSELALN